MSRICFLVIMYQGIMFQAFCQPNNIVIKAWGIEETLMGGAPPTEHEKPLNRTSQRFFLETKPGTKVKVLTVWIGKTAFSVYEEKYNAQAPDQDYRPADMATTKNTFTQILATDSLPTDCNKQPPTAVIGNDAVITYTFKGKKYYAPVKVIIHTRLNLP